MALKDISASIAVVLGSGSLVYVISKNHTFIATILLVPISISTFILYKYVPKEKNRIQEVKYEIENKHYHIKRHQIKDLLKVINKMNPVSTMLLLTGVASATFYAIVWFVVPLEMAKGLAGGLPFFALGIFDLAIVLLGFLLGNVADKFNKSKLVFWGLLLFSISGILIGFNLNILFLFFGFLATTGDEMTSTALWSWLHKLDKDHANDGLIGGVITFAQDLGWVIGPVFAGFLYMNLGATYTILVGGVFVFIVFCIYQFMLFAKKHKSLDCKNVKIHVKPHFRRYKS
jgi:predicted MFS family arabinose efflux permease